MKLYFCHFFSLDLKLRVKGNPSRHSRGERFLQRLSWDRQRSANFSEKLSVSGFLGLN